MRKMLTSVLYVAAFATVWFSTPEVQAQRRSGFSGNVGGVRISVGDSGYGRYNGYGGYNNYGYGRYNNYGYGRYDGYGYGRYNQPYVYRQSGISIGTDTYYGGASRGVWGDSYSPSPMSYQAGYPAAAETANAQVHVRVATPDAEVWFNRSATQQRGLDRVFETPSLDSSVRNSYEIRARWQENGQTVDRTRTVDVNPGRSVRVDFTQP